MFRVGGSEWIIILVVVILLFGPGRISDIAGELGRGIKSFREGLAGKGEQMEKKEEKEDEDGR